MRSIRTEYDKLATATTNATTTHKALASTSHVVGRKTSNKNMGIAQSMAYLMTLFCPTSTVATRHGLQQ
ncbi:hypothetical protein LSAT2_024051 [Lamellibrachia satsuma]|nr:hypothetical protein LSAT2_024051 [Lamellibrachia satsuma]